MSTRTYASGNFSGQPNDWYWKKGLHDAKIITTEFVNLDYDYKLCNPRRNSFTLDIDASGALYDTGVSKIVFYNCTLLTPDVKLDGCWWLQDILTKENDKYVLEITAENPKEEYVFRIKFDCADLTRK